MSTEHSWTVEKNSRDLDSHLLALSGARLIGHGSLLIAELESSHDAIERRKKVLNTKEHRLSVCVLNPFYIFPNSRERLCAPPRPTNGMMCLHFLLCNVMADPITIPLLVRTWSHCWSTTHHNPQPQAPTLSASLIWRPLAFIHPQRYNISSSLTHFITPIHN